MAVDKDKVYAELEKKFKGKSISKTFKQELAAKWAEKIDTEDDIESYVDDREDVITAAISEADRRATEAANKAVEKAKTPAKQEEEPKEDELPADTPAWAKALLKKNETLEAKLNGFEQAQTQKTIAERFKTDERLKGIPEFMLKGRVPSKEEDFETAITELSGEFETWAKENNVQKFGQDKPGGNAPGKGNESKATKEEIDSIADGIMN